MTRQPDPGLGIADSNGREPTLIYATSVLAAKTNLMDSQLSLSTKNSRHIHTLHNSLGDKQNEKNHADYFNKSSRKCDDLYEGSEESKMLMVRVGSRRGDSAVEGRGVDGNKIIVFPSDNTSHRPRDPGPAVLNAQDTADPLQSGDTKT